MYLSATHDKPCHTACLHIILNLSYSYELMSLCQSAEACMRALLGDKASLTYCTMCINIDMDKLFMCCADSTLRFIVSEPPPPGYLCHLYGEDHQHSQSVHHFSFPFSFLVSYTLLLFCLAFPYPLTVLIILGGLFVPPCRVLLDILVPF